MDGGVMKKMMIVAATAALFGSTAHAGSLESGIGLGMRSARGFSSRWVKKTSHRHGELQRLDDAMAHLVSETKPSVVMIQAEGGSGSGFFVDPEGLIATNAHVVGQVAVGSRVGVVFADGRTLPGILEVKGEPGSMDLALVRIGSRKDGWPALKIAEDPPREGVQVVAMGYPRAMPFSVSRGIVSGNENRKAVLVRFYQTDAAVNPGNSGGPLVDMSGRVVGVNTQIASSSGGFEGIAFAISAGDLRDFIARQGKAVPTALISCPDPARIDPSWSEHVGRPPQDILASHLKAPLERAVPMLVSAHLESFWIGASRRRSIVEEGAGCSLQGTVAFYVVGREDKPEVDFVSVIGSGMEGTLRPKLVELRWFDPAEGKRQRWFDEELAKKLGWDRDGRGTPMPDTRPIPLPQVRNDLF